MASTVLYANGLDFDADLGLLPVTMSGLLGAPGRALGVLDLPALPGVIDSGISPRESARVLTITCLVQASSQTTLYATLDTAKEALGTGLVTITSAFSATRAFYGVLQPFDADLFVPTILNGWATVALSFLCPIPYAIALAPSIISFGATAVDIPLGTAPSTLRDQWSAQIEIVGAATTPTLTYLDGSNTAVGTMATSLSPVAGDSIVVDCGRRLVSKFVSGTRTNAISTLTAGYTFPALDPADGFVAGSIWPKLKVSSGTAFLRYYRAWR